tara:strand:- start:543 stop:758 length:216 start_codon:yes stop_codon:yes gene_type:complete
LERLLIPCRLPAGLNLILPVPVLENLFLILLFVFNLGINTPESLLWLFRIRGLIDKMTPSSNNDIKKTEFY